MSILKTTILASCLALVVPLSQAHNDKHYTEEEEPQQKITWLVRANVDCYLDINGTYWGALVGGQYAQIDVVKGLNILEFRLEQSEGVIHEERIQVKGSKQELVEVTLPELSAENLLSHKGDAVNVKPVNNEGESEPVELWQMVLIEGGSFQMGSDDGESDEKPVHEVRLTSFYMGVYEVTVAEFREFIEATNYKTDADKQGWSFVWDGVDWQQLKGVNWECDPHGEKRSNMDDYHPVVHVSWNDAMAYCEWLSERDHVTYRLPTEAEWEYAACGGSNYAENVYAGHDDVHKVAWHSVNSGQTTHRVGMKAPNGYGLYDMSGNVYEWCMDKFDTDYYKRSRVENPEGPKGNGFRSVRGGSWMSIDYYTRLTNRGGSRPEHMVSDYGFRVVRELEKP